MKHSAQDIKRKTHDRTAAIAFALAALAFIVYLPALQNDFIREYDDDDYVLTNAVVLQGITARGIVYAATQTCAANWHPVTMLSHMLDVQMFGVWAFGHHLTNVLLHAANAALLFLLLARATRSVWPSALAAALFAVHPVHIEDVAQIAQRKDVLSTLFMLLALLSYVKAVQGKEKRSLSIAAVFLAFGLLAKPMLVTVPFLMLLLDIWPLRRISFDGAALRRTPVSLVREKAVFFVLAAVISVITLLTQRSAGAVGGLDHFPVALRLENAAISYMGYLRILVWPAGLAAYYPYPSGGYPAWRWLASLVVLAIISIGALVYAKRAPYLFAGWFWFLGTLVPVIGLIQVGGQSMADRYAYVPFMGLYMAISWSISDFATRRRLSFKTLSTAAALVLCTLVSDTLTNIRNWKDAETLWTHAARVTTDNIKAHVCLATYYGKSGRLDEALLHAKEATRIAPKYYPNVVLGNVYYHMNDLPNAEKAYRDALAKTPNGTSAVLNLGKLLVELNRIGDAENVFAHATPPTAESEFAFAQIYLEHKRPVEAERHIRHALDIDPGHASIHYALGAALEDQGRLTEALDAYEKALGLGGRAAEIERAVTRVKRKLEK